jgi:hypothetical protein
VQNHHQTHREKRNAKNGSRMAPLQEPPEDGHKQKIERRRFLAIVVEIVFESAARLRRIGYSCRHLIRSDAPHVQLALNLPAIGQLDMQQQYPIAAHVEIDTCAIAARR